MKKITHITMSDSFGGAETVIFTIIKELRNEFKFEYLCPKGNIEKILLKNNIEFKCFNKKNIKPYIKSIDEGIIHAHDFKASILSAICRKKGVKIISHIHTDHKWLKKFSFKSLIYLLATISFEKIILVSESMAKEMWFYKFIKNKSEILINPINEGEILKLSKSYQIEEKYDLIFLGRLSEYKNPLGFIEIVNLLKKKKENIKAIIIGDGELMDKCRERIRKLNLEDNIEIKGFLENPFPYLKSSKLLVMPSQTEGLSLSAGQAMILGIPVIASNVGGLKDFINNFNGRLCNDINEFVIAIDEILNNERIYNKLYYEAKKEKGYFCSEKYMKRLREIYTK